MEAARRSAWSIALTVAVVSVAWLVFLPWSLSAIGLPDAKGNLFESDSTRFGFIGITIVIAVWCGGLAWRDRDGAVPRGIAAVATVGLWYSWRAIDADVVGTDVWLSALVDVILAPAAAAAFVGSWVGLLVGRRRGGDRPADDEAENAGQRD